MAGRWLTLIGKRLAAAGCGLLFVALALTAQGQEWTRFRGPNGQGVSAAKNIPVKWTEQDYNWKVALPGGGHSSPVIWGDQVYVTSGDQKENKAWLLTLNAADGAERWRKEYTLSPFTASARNSYATGTPALDAGGVYALWPTAEKVLLVALDHKGNTLWERTFSGIKSQHGPGHSPIVAGDLVVFSHEQNAERASEPGCWIALDRRTGETRWQLERKNGPSVSYSTPCVFTPAGGAAQFVFTSRAHGFTGVEPATGSVLWEAPVIPLRVVSSPAIAGDLLLATCGQGSAGKCLVAVRPPAKGGAKEPATAYQTTGPYAPYVPTPLYRDGLVYLIHDRGDASCIDAATGEPLWTGKPGGRFYGSPVWIDGRIYCINTDGAVVVLRAGRKYELLAVNPLGETSQATPAVAGGRLYLRTHTQLISIGGK